ncbi:hypothetical protein G5714_008650 [Onychostoma macrolepis]|uniref:Ig-like domain-containing protein n=1 Tax=Onychostoma macrolepis TaxID=369639 RepID=A0A7J6CW96_9TELE|nr:hypothetical protein G5714_008650 [Onychostoma macrolepis]
MSFIHASLTQERPKPEVKVTPDQRVFRGETVTLTCDIQRAGDIQWRHHSWFKDGNTFYPYPTAAEFSFTASVSKSGEYSCRGERSDSQRSDISAAVTLTVSDSPRSTLTVTPDRPVFTGETVNLTCVIESDHSDWRYVWYKDSVMLQTSDCYTVNRDTLTIRGATESDQGRYWCRGQRDKRPKSSRSRSAVYLSVKDSPRSTLTVTPDSPVFTGETVNLKCVIESHSNWRWRNGLTNDRRDGWTDDWRYEWYKDSVKLQTSDRYTVNRDTLTIRGGTESDQGQYWCRGQRDERPKSSQSSSTVYLSVKDSPRSTLTVTPKTIFTGETVNLTCVIESDHSNWRYEWYKDSVMLQTSDGYTVNRDTLTIRGATESDQGQYWCRGQRDERPQSSQDSNRINLSVNGQISVFNILSFLLAACPYLLSTVVLLFKCCRARDSPTSTLTVTPNYPVFTGETVNLTCVIESHSDWRYEWYKDSVMLQTSDRYTVNRDTLTIRGATESDQGQYWCRGQIRSVSSQSSSTVSLSVKALPRSTLTVTPDSPVFTGETVNLTCVIESDHSDWRYEWFKDSVMLQTSDGYTVNRDTLTIRGATESDQDLPTSTVIVTPKTIFTGETVNLTCVIEFDHNNWRYEWFKDSVMLQTSDRYTVNRDTLTIRGATESDQGQYWCRGQRDERPQSSQESNRINLYVNGQISVFNILSFLLAACPYLLSTVVLLFKCCRARVTSTEDHSQFAVTEEQTSS